MADLDEEDVMAGGKDDDVRIRTGSRDDDVFSTAGTADQPAGPRLPAAGALRQGRNIIAMKRPVSMSNSENDEDFFDDEDCDFGGAHDEDSFLESEDVSANKPLMHPRKRAGFKHRKSRAGGRKVGRRRLYYCAGAHVLRPILFLTLFIVALSLFVFLVLFLVNVYLGGWVAGGGGDAAGALVGCDDISVEDVWTLGLPKLITESAVRLLDVNEDGVLDVVMGFATGVDGYNVPPIVCDIYFSGRRPCQGGVLVVDGATGRELWRHYTGHEVFALTCEQDLSGDGRPDCLLAGRAAVFEALDMSGGQGTVLWTFEHAAAVSIMNVYTAQYLPDLDGDGVPEVLNIHGGDPFGEPGSATRLKGKLFIFSGRTGSVLRWAEVPDGRESYYSPVLYTRAGGERTVLFGTGGETHGGSLWTIPLDDLWRGHMKKARAVYSDAHKGVMTPPVLVDVTGDGVRDVVFATYNSSVLALDGQTYSVLWNFTYPGSETYATPAAGYYNDDDVPDFMVHWQYGPGFPVYYHSITTVLDGRTGRALLGPPYVRDTVGVQTSPLTVSVQGRGHDVFLYWVADCMGAGTRQRQSEAFSFVEGTNVHEKSRADFCRLRFKTDSFSKLYALNRHVDPPGKTLYYSHDRLALERAAWVNSSAEAATFIRRHPEHRADYDAWRARVARLEAYRQAQKTGGFNMSPPNAENTRPRAEGVYHTHPTLSEEDTHSIYPQETEAYEDPDNVDDSLSYLDGLFDGQNNQVLYDEIANIMRGLSASSLPNPVEPSPARGILNDYAQDLQQPRRRTWGKAYRGTNSRTTNYEGPRYRPNDRPLQGKPTQARGERRRDQYSSNRGTDSPNALSSSHLGKNDYGYRDRAVPRGKRHIGPHDAEGLQRLISTGTLAPSSLNESHPDYNHSIDVIFATYWFYPAKTEALLPEDQECIDRKMKQNLVRFDPKSKYYGMDDDGFHHAMVHECLEESQHQNPEGKTYNSQTTYNPYNVHMGQLTLYRLRIKCKCSALSPGKKCAKVLPYDQQQWPGYMGRHADSHWKPRDPTSPG